MAEHYPDFVRRTDSLAGTQSPPRDSSSSSSSSNNIISSATNTATMSNISEEGDDDEDDSLSISSASIIAGVHQEASVCSGSSSSSNNNNASGGCTDKPAAHHARHGRRPSSSPPPSPCGLQVEVDELSSDGDQGQEEEEEEEEARGVESAMNMVVALLEQGQETQERILADLAQKGEVAQRVGRRMAEDAHEALKKGQHEKVVTTGRVKQLLGYFVHRLEKSEQQRRALSLQKDQLRAKLGAKQRNDKALKTLWERADNFQYHLDQEEKKHAVLKREHGQLIIEKKQLKEANLGLKADVAILLAGQRQWEDHRPVEVAEVLKKRKVLEANQEQFIKQTATLFPEKLRLQEANRVLQAEVAHLNEKLVAATVATATPSGGSVGPVVIPAVPPSPSPAATAAEDKSKAAFVFAPKMPSRPRVEAVRPTAFAATSPVGKVVPSPAAVATPAHSPLVKKELSKVYGTPRQYPRRPPLAPTLISGGKGSAGGKAPMMDALTKPAPKRSFTNQEGSSLAAQGATGSADKQGSVAKGPDVKVSRAGGARTERLAKARGGGGGGKVEVVASGRVLRSASRAAAAAAATAAADGTSAVKHTRSTRSTTRRPVPPKTNTTGRGVNSRGKHMNF